jgi:hypothetical protein
MKISIRKMLVLLAIVLSVISIQSVWASCDVSVIGVVTEITYDSNSIKVLDANGLTTVYGIPLTYLANKGIVILGAEVEITASECPNGTDKLSACTLSVNGVTITFPGNRK